MAYPTGNHHQEFNHTHNITQTNSPATVTMKHNPVLSTEWTAQEQELLDRGLVAFASDSKIIQYAKIAQHLSNKTVRDVALRTKWMTKKEISKRRKEEQNITRNSRDKKERVTNSSAKSSLFLDISNGPSSSRPMIPRDSDNSMSYRAIGGGIIAEILQKNARVLNQISANISSHQIQQNIDLFCEARDSILKIHNEMNNMPPAIMRRMPPLPVQLNRELAKTILPLANYQPPLQ